jgi:hypothetical protein
MATAKTRALGHARSTQWPAVEKAHLRKEPFCRYCGGQRALQVHHIRPFHLHPEDELNAANLITLCEDAKDGIECHLHIGHLGNWKLFNPHVRVIADAPEPGTRSTHYLATAAHAA